MIAQIQKIPKKTFWFLGIGFVAGLLWLSLLRFLLVTSNEVHYHANFGLYINGQKEEFKSFTFYEEVQSCTEEGVDDPKSRVHMHNMEAGAVHVHDHAATWGHFFANLGYDLTNKSVTTDSGAFIDGADGKNLTFYLNGEVVSNIANRAIGNLDVLLINYGADNNDTIHSHYDEIPRSAAEHNEKTDPSSCSGGRPLTLTERAKRAVQFWN